MKKIVVAILNYKVKDQTIRCVKSVKKSTYQNIEVIVIDNDSNDGIEKEIKKISRVHFIQNQENLGFSGGNNVGIRKALESEADYVFVLNPDTTVDKQTIGNLVLLAEKENMGIAGPKILFADKKTIWYGGGIVDTANVLGKHRGVDEKDQGQYDIIEITDYVSGAAMFVKREVFEKVGLFDEKYFLYYEDVDFCFRAGQAGFEIMYIPTAVVYHGNAQSTGLGSPLQDYYITRNRLLFAAKFLPLRTKFALVREAINNIFNPVRRLAFIDFLLGNFGRGRMRI